MNKDNEEIRCQTMWQLDQDKKYKEVTAHLLTGCLNCITNPKKRFDGREMLFPDGPPPWIKVAEEDKKNPEAWKKYQKKQVRKEMTQEEFDQYLVDSDISSAQMAFEIAKFRRIEKVQAWKQVIEIRSKQKEIRIEKEKQEKEVKRKEKEAKKEADKVKRMDEKRKIIEQKQLKDEEKQVYLDKMHEEERLLEEEEAESEKESQEVAAPSKPENKQLTKTYNLQEQMPWRPSAYDILCVDVRSALDQATQKRIVAMCQNMLYTGTRRFHDNREQLKDVRKECESEYDTLIAAALEHARKEAIHPIDYMSKLTIKSCLTAIQRREPQNAHYLCKTPVFVVEEVEEIAGIRSEKQAMIPKLEKVLRSSGWNDLLTIPDITKKCQLHIDKRLLPFKPQLPYDETAQALIATCAQVSVMMDATTVCHLLTPNWESRQYEYGIPIVVRTERVDGGEKKIVALSKPLPSNTITRASIQRKTLKRLLKFQFLTRQPPPPFTNKRKHSPQPSTSSAPPPDDDFFYDHEESMEPCSSNSLLDDIIQKMETKPKEKEIFEKEAKGNSSYQYAVFRIGDARLLVRSNAPYKYTELGEKKHSILEKSKVLSFEPKIEYLPNGGAMDLSASEYVWNYTKAIFKMSDSHVLFRTSYRLDNLLQVDALTMKVDLQEPPPGALGLLSTRCVMLERMIAQLESLEDGEYMAFQSENKPLEVVPKCSVTKRGGISLNSMRIKDDDIHSLAETIQDGYFCGFSPDVPLQWQIVQSRAPRMLIAADSNIVKFLPADRSKMEQRKMSVKRKFQNHEWQKEEAKKQKQIDWDNPNLYSDLTNPSISLVEYKRDENDAKRKRGGRPPKFRRGGRGRGGGGDGQQRGGRGGGGDGQQRGGRGGGRGGGQRGRGGRGRGRGRAVEAGEAFPDIA